MKILKKLILACPLVVLVWNITKEWKETKELEERARRDRRRRAKKRGGTPQYPETGKARRCDGKGMQWYILHC